MVISPPACALHVENCEDAAPPPTHTVHGSRSYRETQVPRAGSTYTRGGATLTPWGPISV